jgi:hypothetical protein
MNKPFVNIRVLELPRSSEERFTPAPGVGQNTDEVLTGILGYVQTRMDSLKNEVIIA